MRPAPERGPTKPSPDCSGVRRNASFCGLLIAREADRDEVRRSAWAKPDSGGWQRCRPPFRVRRLPASWRRRTRPPSHIYFRASDFRHIIVKTACLIRLCDPETFPIRNRSHFPGRAQAGRPGTFRSRPALFPHRSMMSGHDRTFTSSPGIGTYPAASGKGKSWVSSSH